MTSFVEPEPPPVQNDLPNVWDLVLEDMKARDEFGFKKYGTHLQPNNGRDFLIDLYGELLDAICYTRGALYEKYGK